MECNAMKVRIQETSLRVRIDEAELAELLAGGVLRMQVVVNARNLFSLRVGLAGDVSLALEGEDWRLDLPEADVLAYVATLPRRDALAFELAYTGAALRIDFEVDVRDSRKLRGP
jgi:hypothetical protein